MTMLRLRKSRNAKSAHGPRPVGRAGIRSADVTGQWCEKQNRGPDGLAGLLRRYRDRQPRASLGPPPPEDIASARGRHPCAEAVGAYAPSIVGLIGPFHLSRPTSNEPETRANFDSLCRPSRTGVAARNQANRTHHGIIPPHRWQGASALAFGRLP